ncbi:hypothetical protein KY285_007644 [Solanum tuberosum]|nr:hypothetical protein KY289_007967 [Solanum tuberosum]KAH0745987.1 hypothetical protein KY285_007644 [Solanum tuberosum]
MGLTIVLIFCSGSSEFEAPHRSYLLQRAKDAGKVKERGWVCGGFAGGVLLVASFELAGDFAWRSGSVVIAGCLRFFLQRWWTGGACWVTGKQ